MSWFVVMWHILLLNLQNRSPVPSDIFSKISCSEPEYTSLDFISFQILLMAVPMFVLISNYLFARNYLIFPISCDSAIIAKPSDFINSNIKKTDISSTYSVNKDQVESLSFSYLKKRIKRHLLLFSFWFSVFLVYIYIAHSKVFFEIYTLTETVSGVVVFLLSGGGSPYYFFLCLTLSLIISYGVRKLSIPALILGFLSATLLIMILPYLALVFKYPSLTAYWNPLNFIPYPMLALLMSRLLLPIERQKLTKNKILKITILILIVLSIFLSVMEWKFYTSDVFFEYQGYGIPAYTRTSLIFSCTAIMLIFLYPSVLPFSRFLGIGIVSFLGRFLGGITNFMAKHALALYCIHFYLIIPVNKMTKIYVDKPVLVVCTSTIITAIISYCLSIILGFYLKDELIR